MSKDRIFSLITGKPGCGKSYFIKKYIIPRLAQKKPVIIFDRMFEYDESDKDVSYKCERFNSFEDFIKSVSRIEKKIYVIQSNKLECLVNGVNFFHQFIKSTETPVSLIFEEGHFLFKIKEVKEKTINALYEISTTGRHWETDCLIVSQRPMFIDPSVRFAFTFVVAFNVTLSGDVKSLQEIDEKSGEVVIDLPPKEFYCFGQKPELFKELKINQISKI